MAILDNEFPYFDNSGDVLTEEIKTLDWINHQIADLIASKQRSEHKIQQLLQHNIDHEGQIQYIHDRYAVTIKTGWNWSFDKKEYAILKNHIPPCFNPVEEKTSYFLNKQVLNDIELLSSGEERDMLLKIFTKEPKKLSITIKPRKA